MHLCTEIRTWKTTQGYSAECNVQLYRNLIVIHCFAPYEDINSDGRSIWEDPPMVMRSNALVCDRSTSGIAGSSLADGMVFVSCAGCVLCR